MHLKEIFTAAQPIKVDFKFGGVVSNDIDEYDLVLTYKMVSVSGVGQRSFDIT